MKKHIYDFSANHDREGEVAIQHGNCQICDRERVVLFADSSEGEYGGIEICMACIHHAFETALMEWISDANETNKDMIQ